MKKDVQHQDLFQKRFSQLEPSLHSYYTSLYQENGYQEFISMIHTMWTQRPQNMRDLDKLRTKDPLWYQQSSMVGMMLYVDNFCETFKSMPEKLDYLSELGVTYLHIMPVFKMPSLVNDGGYAVSDFTSIDSRFGTNEEFDIFTRECHSRKISVCLDFVLNHTSDEHPWALQAKEGDVDARRRYFIFPDRTMPDSYEKYVNEVFPILAPGNFTYNAASSSWILTTFNHYQWDLNYQNHKVLHDMVLAMLTMSNRGVDIFRFDAIPYIWKTWGTTCRNLPEVHTLIRIFRLALEIVAPSTIIKGEVVMAPKEVAPYFGTSKEPECHLLYNVSLMVELWNSLATRDTRMLKSLINSIPDTVPESASWVNYARCHDDIGWGFNDDKARELGYDPFQHKQFLINFYLGAFPGSFAKGELYESDPKTLDARNCGTTASLCGLEKAVQERDEYQAELAIKRIILMQVFTFVSNGIPVIYSGDEIAQFNDYSYIHDPHKSRDSRFLHRPKFDWISAEKRDDLKSYSSQVYQRLLRYIQKAKGNTMMGNDCMLHAIATSDDSTIAMIVQKRDDTLSRQKMVVLANFSEYQKSIYVDLSEDDFLIDTNWTELIQGKNVTFGHDQIIIGPYEILILNSN
jgi:amylosucrase